jgi:hypothetical protein
MPIQTMALSEKCEQAMAEVSKKGASLDKKLPLVERIAQNIQQTNHQITEMNVKGNAQISVRKFNGKWFGIAVDGETKSLRDSIVIFDPLTEKTLGKIPAGGVINDPTLYISAGKLLALVPYYGGKGELRILDVKARKFIKTLSYKTGVVDAAAFELTGKTYGVVSTYDSIHTINSEGEELNKITFPYDVGIVKAPTIFMDKGRPYGVVAVNANLEVAGISAHLVVFDPIEGKVLRDFVVRTPEELGLEEGEIAIIKHKGKLYAAAKSANSGSGKSYIFLFDPTDNDKPKKFGTTAFLHDPVWASDGDDVVLLTVPMDDPTGEAKTVRGTGIRASTFWSEGGKMTRKKVVMVDANTLETTTVLKNKKGRNGFDTYDNSQPSVYAYRNQAIIFLGGSTTDSDVLKERAAIQVLSSDDPMGVTVPIDDKLAYGFTPMVTFKENETVYGLIGVGGSGIFKFKIIDR